MCYRSSQVWFETEKTRHAFYGLDKFVMMDAGAIRLQLLCRIPTSSPVLPSVNRARFYMYEVCLLPTDT